MNKSNNAPRIGYVPISGDLWHPADRRRFSAFAKARNLPFEIADPKERYDFVVVSEAADLTTWSKYPHGKVVFDLIDSYLSVPRSEFKQAMRGTAWYILGRHKYFEPDFLSTLQSMCRRADAVTCSTVEQVEKISPFCTNTHIVLDIHDATVKTTKSNYRARAPFQLVWEGLPSNIPQLESISDVLKEISSRHEVVLNLVTDLSRPRLLGRFGQIDSHAVAKRIFSNIRIHRWDEHTCAEIVCACDLALIPINLDDPFTSGKPENKLLLFWRMGMPVVTSATPAYMRAMNAAGLPELVCRGPSDWISVLESLWNDEEGRRAAAAKGQTFAFSHWGTEQILARWDGVFRSLGFDAIRHRSI